MPMLHRRVLALAFAAAILTALCEPASAGVLATGQDVLELRGVDGTPARVEFSLAVSDDVTILFPERLSFDHLLFDTLSLSPTDAGRTFTATAADTPGFAGAAALLTDGIDQFVGEQEIVRNTEGRFAGSIAVGSPGSNYLFGSDPAGRVDFAGSEVTSFAVHIDDLQFFGSSPNAGVRLTYTFTIEGAAIPEPTGLVLVGLTGLVLRQRRSRG